MGGGGFVLPRTDLNTGYRLGRGLAAPLFSSGYGKKYPLGLVADAKPDQSPHVSRFSIPDNLDQCPLEGPPGAGETNVDGCNIPD